MNATLNIVVKEAGALHRPVVVRQLIHGIYHLDYMPMFLSDIFIQNWITPMMQRAIYERSK